VLGFLSLGISAGSLSALFYRFNPVLGFLSLGISERPTTAVIDISTSRAAGLSGEDIENVGDLAQADVQTVAEAAALTDESARTIISRAQSMVS
jgi:hypothetical protein